MVLCKSKGIMDGRAQLLWFLQAFPFGMASLSILIAYRPKPIEQDEENRDKHVIVTEAGGVPDSQAGVMCKLQERDDIGRIELVQKLARENCQFLQTDKKEQEKSEHGSLVLPTSDGFDDGAQGHVCLISSPLFVPSITALPSARRKQDDEVRTVQVKEQEHNVLVLKRVQCCGPAPPAGTADSDWR
ncbi:hypothetical protein GH733_013341 [Mirounga leonina]|nr:hypothetical protein GH733_013341 [Mirounga leonina]